MSCCATARPRTSAHAPGRRRRRPGVPHRAVGAVHLHAVLRPVERLSERSSSGFTVDHVDRVALVAVSSATDRRRGQIIGVARYDRLGTDEAEVAFNIADAHQGRGLGSVLLEHLAAAARERGMRRFIAEVLPENGRMIAVFRTPGTTSGSASTTAWWPRVRHRPHGPVAGRDGGPRAPRRGAVDARRCCTVVRGRGRRRPQTGETLAGRLAARVLADLLDGDPSVVVHAVGVPGDPAVQVLRAARRRARTGRARGRRRRRRRGGRRRPDARAPGVHGSCC